MSVTVFKIYTDELEQLYFLDVFLSKIVAQLVLKLKRSNNLKALFVPFQIVVYLRKERLQDHP